MQHHRVAPLQYLRVCNSGVGHVGVNPTATHPPRPSTRTSSYCLIVADVIVTKGEVVHAALHIRYCQPCILDIVRSCMSTVLHCTAQRSTALHCTVFCTAHMMCVNPQQSSNLLQAI